MLSDVYGERSVNKCYIGQVLDDGHIELLREPIVRYDASEEVH